MLEELRIRNFAIIDKLDIEFTAGFNVITGETGAGKSILIDAVELLLGTRADSDSVRAGAEKAIIEGVFALNERARAEILPLLQREELLEDESDADFLTLTRELRRTGRSSARINGITVSADLLREVGDILVDIHGQSAHLSLLKPRTHIDLLDRYADLSEVRLAFGQVVEKLSGVREEIRSLMEDKAQLAARAERLRYEVEEIEAANLEAGEDNDLKAERTRLANSEQLAEYSSEAVMLLSGDDAAEHLSAVDQLMQMATLLEKLTRLDPNLSDELEIAQTISDQAQELALTLSDYVDEVEYNPDRLNEVEERLELINSLKRRYKAETIEGVLAYAEKAAKELNSIEHSEERLDELRKQEDKLLHHIGELGLRMSKSRKVAGQKLSRGVVQELKDLRMERARFEIAIEKVEDPDGCFIEGKRYAFDTSGIDQVEFMMSANPGEPMRQLVKVASGGESARIMLALKRVLTQADHTPILIFDEIDQGIGGRVGVTVGEKLWSLSKGHQVLVVTHLPQLAGFGDAHWHVRKSATQRHTTTEIIPLDSDDLRVRELADMLGARSESGLQSAREILDHAREHKVKMSPA